MPNGAPLAGKPGHSKSALSLRPQPDIGGDIGLEFTRGSAADPKRTHQSEQMPDPRKTIMIQEFIAIPGLRLLIVSSLGLARRLILNRKILTIVLATVALRACTTVPPASRAFTQRSADGALLHSRSGFVFPTKVRGFQRERPVQYDQAGEDVSVGYNLVKQNCAVAATVYVYPKRGASLAGEFANRQKEVARAHAGAQLLNTSSVVVTPDRVPAMAASYAYVDVFGGVSRLLRSELLVAEAGARFVEYRFTYPAALEQACHSEVDAFAQTYAWP